jgi:hypothetical protein
MPQIKPPRPVVGQEHLNQVCTLTEASFAWCRGRSTLQYAINRGYLTAARIGRDWLITVPSLCAYYGAPVRPIRR